MSVKCGPSQVTQGATITTKPDGNIQGIQMETNIGETTQYCGAKHRHASHKVCKFEFAKRSSAKTLIFGDSGCPCRIPRHPSQGCCCVSVNKPVDPSSSKVTSPEPICKCGKSPAKELEYEKEMRMRMESEIHKLKLQIADMMQGKCMALNMTKQLKHRYEKMKGLHDNASSQLAAVTREKEFLCRCLEKERLQNQTFRTKDDSSIQVLNKDIDKSATQTIWEQNAKIKSLNDSVRSLSQTVEDKDFEKQKLEHEKEKIHNKLKENKFITKKLSETTAKLAKSVRQKHDSFMALRNKAGKYQKELGVYKDEARRSQLELERLKVEVKKQKNKEDTTHAVKDQELSNLELKLKKTKDRERRSSETIQLLSQKLRDLEGRDPQGAEKDLQRMHKELKTLQNKYDEALKKLQMCGNVDEQRTGIIETQLKTIAEDMEVREGAFLKEKEELKKLVGELQSIIDQQKKRISELEDLKQQQDIVIKTQSEQLDSKEEQIKLREQESDLVKGQYLDLDKRVGSLRSSRDGSEQSGSKISNTEAEDKIKSLSEEIDNLKALLKEDQDKSYTKDKVIEDQYNTIQNLKKQLSTRANEVSKLSASSKEASVLIKSSKDQLERVSRQLMKEQEITRRTASSLQDMRKQKRKLQQDVEDLEEACQEMSSVTFLQRRENEAKSWEEERKKLTEERDRAIEAAKLATRTLMETMDDFQGQIKSQQKLQRIVTDIIDSKSSQHLPLCARNYQEQERRRNMQIAIPCKPVVPYSNLHSKYQNDDEDGFYTATSGKDSGPSDSDVAKLHTPGPSGLSGQHVQNSFSPAKPSGSSDRPCKCINDHCRCTKSKSLVVPGNYNYQVRLTSKIKQMRF